MMEPDRLLRRITLSLAGRLPTDDDERAAVHRHGLEAMNAILDELMKEDAFYVRLKEAFNDIFPTQGIVRVSELLVFNGFDCSDNNHSPCSRYMATGMLDSLAAPTFAAMAAACKSPDSPLAFLTFGQYSATGNLVPMSRGPDINSLKLLANADAISGQPTQPYHNNFVIDRIERTLEVLQANLFDAGLIRDRTESENPQVGSSLTWVVALTESSGGGHQ